MDNFTKLIEEYPEDYCLYLEATYSEGMMSEGGKEAVDNMFNDIDLRNKTLLDIGFGLGGVVLYLADKHDANVTGIELNPWMVQEATRRTPEKLKSRAKFIQYEKPPLLPLEDNTFDIVYSKGVLTHLDDKTLLFKEVYRVLKPHGLFIIDDWLSPTKGCWGERLQKMCEMENLTLFAETEVNYIKLLRDSGFSNVAIRDENKNYARYNEDIVAHLKSADYAKTFVDKFGEKAWQESIECYQLTADSIKDNELLIRRLKAEKA